MNILKLIKVISLGICFFCYGCNGHVMSNTQIEKIISENLKSGSSDEEIIDFFESYNWVYDFDHHVGRYQARNPEEDELPEMQGRNQIYIYVNDKREFVRAEVEKVFNGL